MIEREKKERGNTHIQHLFCLKNKLGKQTTHKREGTRVQEEGEIKDKIKERRNWERMRRRNLKKKKDIRKIDTQIKTKDQQGVVREGRRINQSACWEERDILELLQYFGERKKSVMGSGWRKVRKKKKEKEKKDEYRGEEGREIQLSQPFPSL